METSLPSFSEIVDNLHEGLYVVDRNRKITFWNKAAEQVSGFAAREVIGKSCSDNILTHIDAEGNHLCVGVCPLAHTIEDGQRREAKVYLHHKDGHRVPVTVRVSPFRNESGAITGGVELFLQVGDRNFPDSRIVELEKMAMLDRLTQIPNRNYLDRELERRLEEKRLHNLPFGFLFMDIDHFKSFNDTYGHEIGDKVLKFVATTLIRSTRPSDVFGRWGGEEFVGILPGVDLQGMETLGNRLRLLVQNSYIMHENARLSVTISIGACLGQDDDTIDGLLSRADKLLYESKSAGRNRLTMG